MSERMECVPSHVHISSALAMSSCALTSALPMCTLQVHLRCARAHSNLEVHVPPHALLKNDEAIIVSHQKILSKE